MNRLANLMSGPGRALAPLISVFLFAALNPGTGFAQQAEYLKGATPWQKSTKGISGLWRMQGYLSSTTNPPRARAAKTVDGT